MNFIYGAMSMVIFGLIFLICGQVFFPTTGAMQVGVLQGLGGFVCVVGLLYGLIVGMFYNMYAVTEAKETYNTIKSAKKKIKVQENSLEAYKTEFTDILTKAYPKYEKEVFEGMNNNDSESLTALMTKYPELKFDGVLNTYINGINQALNNIKSLQIAIEDHRSRIDDFNTNGWVFEFNKPAITKLLDKLED